VARRWVKAHFGMPRPSPRSQRHWADGKSPWCFLGCGPFAPFELQGIHDRKNRANRQQKGQPNPR
jgi:hypothetical protein